jgi:hypothetical protein
MECWVGWGVIAHDLRTIAAHQADRAARQANTTTPKIAQAA